MDIADHNRYLVTKSNELIKSGRYSLTKIQERLVLLLISNIEPGDTNFRKFTYDIKQVIEVLQLGEDVGYSQLKECVRDLVTREIYLEHEDGTYTVSTWLAGASTRQRGKISLEISDTLKPYLLQLKSHFTRMELQYLIKAKNLYSVRWYELLKMKIGLGVTAFEEPIEAIRNRLQLNKKYKLYADLKRRAIDPPLTEINEKMDISLKYEEVREGRKVVSIRIFDINSRDGKTKLPPLPKLPQETKKTLLEYGFGDISHLEKEGFDYLVLEPKELNALRDEFENNIDEYVNSKIELLRRSLKKEKGAPKNPGGYLRSAIQNHWQDEYDKTRKKRKLEKAKTEVLQERQAEIKAKEQELDDLKRRHYTEKWNLIEDLFIEDPSLKEKVSQNIPRYDPTKGFESNLTSPVIKAHVINKITDLYSGRFEELRLQSELREKKKEAEIIKLKQALSQTNLFV